jgi:hypothetical protein
MAAGHETLKHPAWNPMAAGSLMAPAFAVFEVVAISFSPFLMPL